MRLKALLLDYIIIVVNVSFGFDRRTIWFYTESDGSGVSYRFYTLLRSEKRGVIDTSRTMLFACFPFCLHDQNRVRRTPPADSVETFTINFYRQLNFSDRFPPSPRNIEIRVDSHATPERTVENTDTSLRALLCPFSGDAIDNYYDLYIIINYVRKRPSLIGISYFISHKPVS